MFCLRFSPRHKRRQRPGNLDRVQHPRPAQDGPQVQQRPAPCQVVTALGGDHTGSASVADGADVTLSLTFVAILVTPAPKAADLRGTGHEASLLVAPAPPAGRDDDTIPLPPVRRAERTGQLGDLGSRQTRALFGGSEQRTVQMMRGPSNKVNEGPHEESAFALHRQRTGPV